MIACFVINPIHFRCSVFSLHLPLLGLYSGKMSDHLPRPSRCFTETFELAIAGPPRLVSRQRNGVQCTTPRGTASALAASPVTGQRGAWHPPLLSLHPPLLSLDDPPLLFASSCYVQEDEPTDELFASEASDKGGKGQRGRVFRSSAPSARLDQIARESIKGVIQECCNECTSGYFTLNNKRKTAPRFS